MNILAIGIHTYDSKFRCGDTVFRFSSSAETVVLCLTMEG